MKVFTTSRVNFGLTLGAPSRCVTGSAPAAHCHDGLVPTVRWRVEYGEAVAEADNQEVWRDAPDGGLVLRVLAVPGSEDRITLLDCDARPVNVEPWHPFPNILRLSPEGVVKWRCSLWPQETAWKCYLSVAWDSERLVAEAPSYQVTLDASSGSSWTRRSRSSPPEQRFGRYPST